MPVNTDPALTTYVKPEGHSGWPFRTDSAALAWETFKGMKHQYPESSPAWVLQRALQVSGIDSMDITPEDWRLLEMAVSWFVTQKYGE